MNTKTTLGLALVLIFGIGGLYLVKTWKPAAGAPPTAPAEPNDVASKRVFEDQLGEVEKVTVAKAGASPLTFEKRKEGDPPTPTWYITAPFEAKATTWEIDRIPREIGQLAYEISYKPGEAGSVTPEQAGLAPPTAVITLTTEDGKEAKLEVGRPATSNETYVRVAGAAPILVAKSNVANLIKKEPAEYRDAQVWSFEPANVKRVEIVEHSGAESTDYVFVRDGSRWMMESPVTARATDKVDDALKAVSKLRVAKWEPQAQGHLAAVGLDPAAVTATFTVEEKASVAKTEEAEGEKKEGDGEKPAEPATETKTKTYTLHLSNLSPIGEDTKTYLRIGDEPGVATVMKTTADKLKPVMSEWRDMRLVTDDATKANKIELTAGSESATLDKAPEGWKFEGGSAADGADVKTLLDAISKLKGVVFVEPSEGQPSKYGFDSPRASVAVTIPGVEGARRITIGGFTDEQTKKMAYVRRDDASTIAKVTESELTPLLRGPAAYKDRSVLSIAPDQVQRFSITRQNPFTNERETISLAMTDGAWHMTEPVAADAREAKEKELLDAIAHLQADRVVPESEAPPIANSLQEPVAQLNVTYRPPAEAASGDNAEGPKPPPALGPEVTTHLAIAASNGKHYGRVGDQPTIYELPAAFFDKLTADYRAGTVLKFNPEDVSKFSIKEGGKAQTLIRRESKWIYEAEPDLPLDQTKVGRLLDQFKDLKTERFAANTASDVAAYGLAEPERELRITMKDGKEMTLSVSSVSSQVASAPGRFAASSEAPGVFIVSEPLVQQVRVDLDALSTS